MTSTWTLSDDQRTEMHDLYRHLHAHPELSMQEHRTAELIEAALAELEIESFRCGGTGVVGILRNGDGPVIGFRADTDGLPIQEDTGATIDIQEDGTVFIAGVGGAGTAAAERIKAIVKVPEVGEEYTGRVVGIQPFGAFVELLPGKDGLLHISRVAQGRVDKVEDVLNIGDEVRVRVLEVDEKGKISLDRIDKPEAPAGSGRPHGEKDGDAGRPRREHRGPRRRPGDKGEGGDDRPRPRRHHGA